MKSFRFPRLAIFLMLATFLTIIAAISLAAEMSRTVQAQYPGPNLPAMWWHRLPGIFAAFLPLWGIGAIGYGVLFALRRTAAQRFPNIDTWPERRPQR